MIHSYNDKERANACSYRVPLSVVNNVPLIRANLGHKSFNILVDSGAPVNIIPLKVLRDFEADNRYECSRFDNALKLQAHNSGSLNLQSYGVMVPFEFSSIDGEKRTIFFPFLVEQTDGNDIILGLPSIAALDIQLENLKSTCTLSFKKSAEKLKPLTPLRAT